MLSFLLFVVGVLPQDTAIIIAETEIFKPISRYSTLLIDDHLLLLNRDEDKIQVFDLTTGEQINSWGSAGEGPGEFRRPYKLFAVETGIAVSDSRNLSFFAKDGAFLHSKRLKMPSIYQTSRGWVWGSQSMYIDPENGQIIAANNDLTSKRVITAWGEDKKLERAKVMQHSRHRERTQIEVSRDKARVYIRVAGTKEVRVYNAIADRMEDSIKLPIREVPYDRGHWQEREQALKEGREKRGFPHRPRAMPDYYPMVQFLYVDLDGLLNVLTVNEANPRTVKTLTFNLDGNLAKSRFSRSAMSRTLGIYKEKALVTMYSEGIEEVQIALVPIKDLDAFVREHPYATLY